MGAKDGVVRETTPDFQDLANMLSETTNLQGPIGRILFLQDLNRDLVELLGSSLGIDPMFFATHVYGPYNHGSSPKPLWAKLPSKVRKQNFLNLQYQRVIEFDGNPGPVGRLIQSGNVPRKVAILPPTKNKYLGLTLYSCSALLHTPKSGPWTGVVLVDASTTEKFICGEREVTLRSRPFQGGYEDFLDFDLSHAPEPTFPERGSMLGDLIAYWKRGLPPGFRIDAPSLIPLSYYPLRIMAGEWVNYIEAMRQSIKRHEYSTDRSAHGRDLATLDSDLLSLQIWGRRCMQTRHKLGAVIFALQTQMKLEPALGETYALVVNDYEYLASRVETYSRRLETLVPVVTSLVQIADTRRSLDETANVTRLTYLALFFVPLSFVTGLFSMNDGVSTHGLKVYFSVAVPLSVFVFSLARLLPYLKSWDLSVRTAGLKRGRDVKVDRIGDV